MLRYFVRSYCVSEHLFSAGSCDQYEKMLAYFDKNIDKVRDVAVMIWTCSITNKTIDDIENDLNNIINQL